MLFNSLQFLIFFPIVLLVYYIIPKRIRYIWLLVASYYFYMCWNVKYAFLILFSTLSTYVCAFMINKFESIRKRKIFLLLGLITNLLILFFFKYFNFSARILNFIFQTVNINLIVPKFDVLLPVGISFYTFQALSYLIDVYRGDTLERNVLRYALFVSFFPQLVAGPIERSDNLLKQLREAHFLNFDDLREGLLLIIWGLFLKLVIADRLSIFVDCVYADYLTYPGFYIVVATIFFSFQIYCDFYSYSIIAKGAAKMFGINLMENFDAPYLSQSVSEFWRRWHISLTSWFKDYLYIPLGGNRYGRARKFLNKLIVFLVSGLWHGASFTFIAWGGLNGLYQIIGEITNPIRKYICERLVIKTDTICHKIYQIIFTYSLICFSWIFFRANSFRSAIKMIKSMLSFNNWRILFDGSLYNLGLNQKNFNVILLCLHILLIADIFKYKNIKINSIIAKQNVVSRWLIIAFSVCFICIFGIWGTSYNPASFIYFQF